MYLYLLTIYFNIMMKLCCVNGAIATDHLSTYEGFKFVEDKIVKEMQIANQNFVKWYGLINSTVSQFYSSVSILNLGFNNLNAVLQQNMGNRSITNDAIWPKVINIEEKLNKLDADTKENNTRRLQEIEKIQETGAILDNATRSLQTKYDNLVQDMTPLSDFQTLSEEFRDFKSTTQDHNYQLDILSMNCGKDKMQEIESSLARLEGVIQTEIARVESQVISCQSGTVERRASAPSKLLPNLTELITFQTPFHAVPHVIVGIIVLDSSSEYNLRVRIDALNITTRGFTAIIHTWNDTANYMVRMQWMACGK